jgi:hypothetical protein
MKGGKGGRGRSNAPDRPVKKLPHPVVKKGAPKRDWGAVPVDDLDGSRPKPTGTPGKGKRA